MRRFVSSSDVGSAPATSSIRSTADEKFNFKHNPTLYSSSDTGRKIDPTPVSVNFIPDTFGPISDQEIRYVLF